MGLKELKHGDIERRRHAMWWNARKCDVHGWHGPLYVCQSYPKALKKKIRSQGYKFSYLCRTGKIKIKVINAINQTQKTKD